jgi:hypothetical protein
MVAVAGEADDADCLSSLLRQHVSAVDEDKCLLEERCSCDAAVAFADAPIIREFLLLE